RLFEMLPQTVATFVSFPLNHPASSCSVGCLDWNCFHSTRGFFSLGCMGMRQSPSLRYSSTKLGSSVIGVRLRYGLRRREAHGDPEEDRRDVATHLQRRISDRTSVCYPLFFFHVNAGGCCIQRRRKGLFDVL